MASMSSGAMGQGVLAYKRAKEKNSSHGTGLHLTMLKSYPPIMTWTYRVPRQSHHNC